MGSMTPDPHLQQRISLICDGWLGGGGGGWVGGVLVVVVVVVVVTVIVGSRW